jgi:D-alanine-D-alanine ligase
MTKPTLALRCETRDEDREVIRRMVESTGVFNAVEVDVAVELVDDRLKLGSKSEYHFLFADQDGRTIGYTCYGPIPLTQSSFDLYWIAVDKAMHGQRVGRLLLERTEELVYEMGGRQLYIETSNRQQYAPTRGFYLRCGYEQAALLNDFYAPGDDKVIYAKQLKRGT